MRSIASTLTLTLASSSLFPSHSEQQAEKAFQKQQIFNSAKVKSGKKVSKTKRWYKDVGLGFKVRLAPLSPLARPHCLVQTPATAINGTYIDKKWCVAFIDPRTARADPSRSPFTGEVSIRGRILTGNVVSTKMTRTIVIRREYLHFVPKYSRYEKRYVRSRLLGRFRADMRTDTRTCLYTALLPSVSKSATWCAEFSVVRRIEC